MTCTSTPSSSQGAFPLSAALARARVRLAFANAGVAAGACGAASVGPGPGGFELGACTTRAPRHSGARMGAGAIAAYAAKDSAHIAGWRRRRYLWVIGVGAARSDHCVCAGHVVGVGDAGGVGNGIDQRQRVGAGHRTGAGHRGGAFHVGMKAVADLMQQAPAASVQASAPIAEGSGGKG